MDIVKEKATEKLDTTKMKNQTCRTPTSGEDGTSPNMWIETVDIAIDSGLKLGLTL